MRAPCTSDPLHQAPRLPRKSHQQSCSDQATPGRTSDPLESAKDRACHANHTSKAAATKRPQVVHPTPWRAPRTAPATQITPAKLRLPSGPRSYIRPLGERQGPRLPRKSHRQSCDYQAIPGRTSDPLESTKYRACHANHSRKAAATKRSQGVHPTPW